jgi:hypothetical protein
LQGGVGRPMKPALPIAVVRSRQCHRCGVDIFLKAGGGCARQIFLDPDCLLNRLSAINLALCVKRAASTGRYQA